MVQRDIIKDQVEQLGKVLSKLMGKMLGIANDGNIMQTIDEHKKECNELLNIQLDEFLQLDEQELKKFLQDRHFNGPTMEQFADYFRGMGEQLLAEKSPESTLFFQKSYTLYRLAGEHSQLFSLARSSKERQIQELILQANSLI